VSTSPHCRSPSHPVALAPRPVGRQRRRRRLSRYSFGGPVCICLRRIRQESNSPTRQSMIATAGAPDRRSGPEKTARLTYFFVFIATEKHFWQEITTDAPAPRTKISAPPRPAVRVGTPRRIASVARTIAETIASSRFLPFLRLRRRTSATRSRRIFVRPQGARRGRIARAMQLFAQRRGRAKRPARWSGYCSAKPQEWRSASFTLATPSAAPARTLLAA